MEDIYFEQQSEASTIDDIFNIQQDKRINASSYGFLAPVYDFIYQRHWDYEGQFQKFTSFANGDYVVELGCGPGRLLSKIEDEYSRCLGVDYSTAMLNIASQRVNCPLVKDDITSFSEYTDVDSIACMGRVVSNLRTDQRLYALGETLDENVSSGTELVFNTFTRADIDPNRNDSYSWSGERYSVRRYSETTIPQDEVRGVFTVSMDYEIHDCETDREVSASEEFNIRGYDEEHIRNIWSDFDIRIVDKESESSTETFYCTIC